MKNEVHRALGAGVRQGPEATNRAEGVQPVSDKAMSIVRAIRRGRFFLRMVDSKSILDLKCRLKTQMGHQPGETMMLWQVLSSTCFLPSNTELTLTGCLAGKLTTERGATQWNGKRVNSNTTLR
jgi:hypothetical protein